MKTGIIFILIFFSIFSNVELLEITDEEYALFPPLYHLDDYDRCLLRDDGLYCLGEFHIYAGDNGTNTKFDLLKEYSSNKYNFNRTLLHRGYCVSTRCPPTDGDAATRFERCVDDWARTKSLRTRLNKLHYCHTRSETRDSKPIDTPKRVFLYVIFSILLMNIIGTVYDSIKGGSSNKNSFITAWSIKTNWNKYKDSSLRNSSILESIRTLFMFVIIMTHTFFISIMTYEYEPREVEKYIDTVIPNFMKGGLSLAHTFLQISIYFTTLELLKIAEKKELTLKLLLKIMLGKIIKRWPMYIIGVGFAATWWVDIGSGPMWSFLVEPESNTCRYKFWSQAFFLTNYVEPEKLCLLSNWILVLEMQYTLAALFIALLLVRYKRHASRILLTLFIFAVVATFIACYVLDLNVFSIVNPESVKVVMVNEPAFVYGYFQPWNCLIISVSGILLAYIQYGLQTNEIKPDSVKWLAKYPGWFLFALLVVWISLMLGIFRHTDGMLRAMFMTVDKVITSLFLAFQYFSMFNIKPIESQSEDVTNDAQAQDEDSNDKVKKEKLKTKRQSPIIVEMLKWEGWTYINRVSLAVSTTHWQVLMFMMATKRNLYEVTIMTVVADGLFGCVLSLAVALPLTILVQYPCENFLKQVINKIL